MATLRENQLREIIEDGAFFESILTDARFTNRIEKMLQRNFKTFQQANKNEIEDLWYKQHALNQLLIELNEPIILAKQATDELKEAE
jgi:hypothetical protein